MRFIWRWFWRISGLMILVVLLYQFWILVHVWYWADNNPKTTAFMDARWEAMHEADRNAVLQQKWVPYERISINLKRAVVAAEDSKFLEHEGFDWEGIQNAYVRNMKKGKIVAGGSTISQQLAKNLFLSGARTPWRKAQEAVITFMLETLMSKRRILELYLNVVEWGEGIFGAEAASIHYYGVSAANLSAPQAARLAAMLPKPRFYDKKRGSSWLRQRTGTIQARMSLVSVP